MLTNITPAYRKQDHNAVDRAGGLYLAAGEGRTRGSGRRWQQ